MRRSLPVCTVVVLGVACENPAGVVLPDDFIVGQMNVFYQQGARIVQSYAADPNLHYRGDVYDTALAIIHLLTRREIELARPLADALVFLVDRDPIPDGRLHAAYYANNLLDPAGQYTSILDPTITPGNMAWAGIALARFHRATGEQKYLTAATRIGDWILNNCKRTDAAGGFTGGLSGWSYEAVTWRSTEHNIDTYALGLALHELTGDQKWRDMALHAQAFVRNMFVPADGYYLTGTRGPDGTEPNPTPIPADAQAWAVLAGIDDEANLGRALQWALDHLTVTESIDGRTYTGIRFSTEGDHIMSEATAGVAAALLRLGRDADAASLLDALADIQASAPGGDGQGLMATPNPGGAPTGYGFDYPNSMHVASTAWTGLARMMLCDMFANPLGALPPAEDRADRLPGDYDCDCDVDEADFMVFEACGSGPDVPYAGGCGPTDHDNDNDVDQSDFSTFQRCYSGENKPLDPGCAR